MERSSMSRNVKRSCFALTAVLAGACYGQVAPTKGTVSPAGGPPPYTLVRWNEDYSFLKNAPHTDLFDSIKYIPLGPDDWYVSLGGQYRYRYEYFNNLNFSPPGLAQDEDGYHLNRILAHADLHFGPNFRVFVQGKSSMEDGRDGGPRPVDADEADIQQLFADASFALGGKDSVTLRFGRQDLLYGAQRMISPLDWVNTRRTFEGGKGSVVLGNQTIDLFWVRPVDINKEQLNDGDGQTSFAGVYDSISLPEIFKGGGTKLDVYGLALNRTNARFAANAAATTAARDEDRYTAGVRLASNPKPFDFDVEADYQFGTFGAQDISAWSIALEGGYTLANCPTTPRLYVGFDAASGNDNGDKGTFGTFNQLFPLGHAYFGYIDVIGRQNIIDLHPGVEITPIQNARFAKKVTLRTDYHLFWRENENDAVYTVSAGAGSSPATAGVLRAASGSTEKYIGAELDLLLNWQVDRHLLLYGGDKPLFPPAFVPRARPGPHIEF